MNEKKRTYLSEDDPPKVDWVIHKLPIKSGSVIRAAMRRELYAAQVPWSIIEGVIYA